MAPTEIEVGIDQITVRSGRRIKRIELTDCEQPVAVPLIKWAGGKQWLAPAASSLLPSRWTGKYYEPFLGGGAMFFGLAPHQAVLSDRNSDLMRTYVTVRNDPEAVINLLASYPYEENFYYRVRARRPKRAVAAAVRFLFLNRSCWNGLYRVNRQGQFNTPFGRFVNPTICDRGRIRTAAAILRGVTLRTGDFEVALSEAQSGDFVYLDPPYVSGHTNNGFLKYNASLFAWADQQRLANCARRLTTSGVHVMVSNADHRAVVSLYKGFHYYRAVRRSLISANSSSRGVVREALLSSYQLLGVTSEIIC